ncbi:hypothetical protein ACG873_29895 [Mesorhizobium sp. AaZ16]|uniref:hypothetical protein n=1 Tax=Mesorhizobium sp. AaZ16 TaxID=3402289 RepID=UPI00374FA1BE
MGFEDEEQALPAGTTFTPSVLKDFRCDLETDCRCSPEMRPTCEYNVKTLPARSSVIYRHSLRIAKKAETAKKPNRFYEVTSPMAVRLLLLLLAFAGAVVAVTWHFGEWIRYSIQ